MNSTIIQLFISLAWRNLWRNSRRTLISFSSIVVGVWSMIILASFMDAWAMSAFQASIDTLVGHGQIHAPAYLDDPTIDHSMAAPESRQRALLNSQQISAWASRVRVPAFIQSERENAPITLVGIQPQAEKGLSFIADSIYQGEYFKDASSDGILLGRKLARRLRTGLNKRLVILSQSEDGSIAERGFRVVGLFSVDQENTETTYAFIGIKQAQALLHMGNDISEISFKLNELNQLDTFINQYRSLLNEMNVSRDIKSWDELQPFVKAIQDMSAGTIALFTFIMFILIAFGLLNTLLMAVYERSREFGLLQALGMKPAYLLLMILVESVFLMGLGVLLGYFTGILTLMSLSEGIDLGVLAEGAVMFGAGRVLYPQVDGLQSLWIAMFIWAMGILTSLYPAWRASREVPVEIINKAF